MEKYSYVPLNVQSCYSILKSSLRIDDLVKVSKAFNYESIALCDIDKMYAYVSFDKELNKNSIKAIFGVSLIVDNYRLHFFIKNEEGYKNICQLQSLTSISKKDLLEHKDGLVVVFSMSSFKDVRNDDLHDTFVNVLKGLEDTYIGIEYYKKEDKERIKYIRDLVKTYPFDLVAFNAHRHLKKEDGISLKILNAIKNGSELSLKEDPNSPYYFLSNKALETLYTYEELNNTSIIASKCDFKMMKPRGRLLEYPINSSLSKKKYLYFLCVNNAKNKQIELTQKYLDRLNYELDVIESMGYLDYFLIVSDYVNYGRNNNISIGPGRGSASGALISYLLNITTFDPLKYDLLFERFLNPERKSLPDVDIDVEDIKRQDLIDYIFNRFNKERCSFVVTFSTFGPKQAIRDIGRIFKINQLDINHLIACLKKANGRDDYDSFDEAFENNVEFKKLCQDEYFFNLVLLAKRIEGLPRQTSVHASAIIINDQDLKNVIPVNYLSEDKLISQFAFTELEELGFLKMDILGLRNLTTIRNVVERIRKYHPSFVLEDVSLEDQNTFNTLNKGLTTGIFQIEKEMISSKIKKVKIESFEDIGVLLALNRPASISSIDEYARNKNDKIKINYLHPVLEEVLEPTHGILLYQEQVMLIVNKLAGLSLSKAYFLIKAISKKKAELISSLKEEFISGCLNNNLSKDKAEEIFKQIEIYGNYGFNKSHSVGYGLITYWEAYLKTNYPKEFYATYLQESSLSSLDAVKALQEIKYFNLKINTPNINVSSLNYETQEDSIYVSLSGIKGISSQYIEYILYERQKGRFNSFLDFIKRTVKYKIPTEIYIKLIDSGSLDLFNYNRPTLRYNLMTLIEYASNFTEGISLLDESKYAPKMIVRDEEVDSDLIKEKEVLGLSISKSLFSKYQKYLALKGVKLSSEVCEERKTCKICLYVQQIKTRTTKKNDKMITLSGFDDSMIVKVFLFKDACNKYQDILKEKESYIFTGYFKQDDESYIFTANEVERLENK